MKPDRILLAELRSEEAFDYLRNVNWGIPGPSRVCTPRAQSLHLSSSCCW